MNYFQIFSIVWGVAMVGIRVVIQLIPTGWANFELGSVYTKHKPKWIYLVALVSTALVIYTWRVELTTDIPYSLVVSILSTMTLIKISQLLFNYDAFRRFVKKALVEDRSIIAKINLASTIVGIALIALGLFVY